MRPRMFLYFAGFAVCVLSTALGQTTSNPPEYAPPPASVPAGSLPAQAPYENQTVPNAPSSPTPQTAPPPAVTTAPPTAQVPFTAYAPYDTQPPDTSNLGSTYIPVDSWVYPAMTRLYGLGYVDTMFLGMRPWTRLSVLHMLEKSQEKIVLGNDTEAQGILAAVLRELREEISQGNAIRGSVYGVQSVYTRFLGISGPILNDSFHLGQTIFNDYARPNAPGFNNITGFSTLNEKGRFSFYLRGEYEHSPSASGYSPPLVNQLLAADYNGSTAYSVYVPTYIVPIDPVAERNPFRIVEATLSVHLLGHEISGGKSDAWLGPAQGGSLAWSNNAENIYSFRINRVEPLHVPWLSRYLGPLRYDFFYGSLKGHSNPNSPYVHSEMFSFRPTGNFEFGFQRSIIFGGADHAPVNLHLFLKGFFDISDTTAEEKLSRDDPGARFTAFNMSYRLPFVRNYLTFYVDSFSHDDVTPISAPRRAAFRTGLYLSQFPKLKKLDLRAEAVLTDPRVTRSNGGYFYYWEVIQLQGYTNKGYLMGDWIGREAKGGQAWLTYHLSGNEWVQFEYLNKKTAKDFVEGTTQNQYRVSVVKRLGENIELNGWFQYERWKAPIYKPGLQTNTTTAFQVTWFPRLFTKPQER